MRLLAPRQQFEHVTEATRDRWRANRVYFLAFSHRRNGSTGFAPYREVGHRAIERTRLIGVSGEPINPQCPFFANALAASRTERLRPFMMRLSGGGSYGAPHADESRPHGGRGRWRRTRSCVFAVSVRQTSKPTGVPTPSNTASPLQSWAWTSAKPEHCSFGTTAAAPIERLRKEVGTDVDVTEFGSVLSVQANGWWLWAPRCVQAKYTENGWRTSITHSGKCPDS